MAKGISIILVILGHCLPDNNIFKNYIYSFHMPLFYIVSGMFYVKRNIKEQLRRDFKKLIVPYLATSLCIIVLKTLESFISGTDVFKTFSKWCLSMLYGTGEKVDFLGLDVQPIGAIWFLLSLFWTKLLYNVIVQVTNSNSCKIYIIIIFLSIFGLVLPKYIWLPLSIETSLITILFYRLGYDFKHYNIIEHLNAKKIVLLTLVWGTISCKIQTSVVSSYYSMYYINILSGVIGSIVLLYFCIKLKKIEKAQLILTWFGNNSLFILCFHAIEGRGVIPWNRIIHMNNLIIRIMRRMLFAIICSYIWVKLKQFFVEKNNRKGA